MSALREKLQQEFLDEEYRYAYDEGFANSRMATQIKVIREQVPLTQAELAERAGMKQSRISTLENVNYSAWSISTLRRLARALGVRLSFGFESWGELLPEVESFSRESLQRVPFEKDPAFQSLNSEEGKSEKESPASIPILPPDVDLTAGTIPPVTHAAFAEFVRENFALPRRSKIINQSDQPPQQESSLATSGVNIVSRFLPPEPAHDQGAKFPVMGTGALPENDINQRIKRIRA